MPATEEADPPPLCQACGACCFGDTPHYVPVSGDDYSRLAATATRLARFDGNRCFMRMQDGHCAALRFDPAAGGFACEVYGQRPEICRELARGSASCEAEQLRKSAAAVSLITTTPPASIS